MAEVNVGLRRALQSLTKVEADLLNDATRKKLELVRAKIASKIKRPVKDVQVSFGRSSKRVKDGEIVFNIEVSVSPDEKRPRGFSVGTTVTMAYLYLRNVQSEERKELLAEQFMAGIRTLADEIDVEYSPKINCPKWKCHGKATRIPPAIPRQFHCKRCKSYIIECPRCREVSLFTIPGSHKCEDCGWELIAGEENGRDERGRGYTGNE